MSLKEVLNVMIIFYFFNWIDGLQMFIVKLFFMVYIYFINDFCIQEMFNEENKQVNTIV